MIRIEDEMHRNVGESQSLIAGSDLATQAKAAERQEAERRELQAKEQVSRERGYWVRVEIMGPPTRRNVREPQSVLIGGRSPVIVSQARRATQAARDSAQEAKRVAAEVGTEISPMIPSFYHHDKNRR
eukprot:COSAG06_NODE_18001_length_909_cov_1.029630_1_plen_128_part_00